MSEETVLVTGGSGFIATHCILQLLDRGYRVRATIRSLAKEAAVRQMLRQGGMEAGERLSFVTADLCGDKGWAEATAGASYVLHGASPTPSGPQQREEDWVKPAVDGTIRVLRAARDAGTKRVVLTSAFGAVGMGHKSRTKPFDETDWTNLKGNVAPYQKSKTLSERAAWRFIGEEGGALQLSVVNPVAVCGPVLGPDYSHSIALIKRMLDGMPGCPKINSCFVDVRDVADLHLRAMLDPMAKGERFLASSGDSLWLTDVAKLLKRRMGGAGARVNVAEISNWKIRLASICNPGFKALVPMLGNIMNATSEKAQRLLGWKPRSTEEGLVATAESLLNLGLLES